MNCTHLSLHIQAAVPALVPELAELCVDYYANSQDLIQEAHGRVHALLPDLQERVQKTADSVRELAFQNDPEITEENLHTLAQTFKKLCRIDIRGCPHVVPMNWDGISSANAITHEGFQTLCELFWLHAAVVVQVTDRLELLFEHPVGDNQRSVTFFTAPHFGRTTLPIHRPEGFDPALLESYRLPADAVDPEHYSTIMTERALARAHE